MIYKSYADLSEVIKNNLGSLTGKDYDLVVGIPRSGMIPATMIAVNLEITLCSYNELIRNEPIDKRGKREIKRQVLFPQDAKKILIIEDSYASGMRFKDLFEALPKSVQKKSDTMVIYSSVTTPWVDIYLEHVPIPRLFEWNIYHHEESLENSCFDMDGILCDDPTDEQNDDDEKYLHFVLNARPKFIPVYKIKTIVTSRLEKYRKPTEEWLKKHNVKYGKLVMLSGYTAEERARLGVHGGFKAREYAKDDYTHGYSVFFESNYQQAIEISRLTGKLVFCTDKNIMIYPEPPQPSRRSRAKDFVKQHAILKSGLTPAYKLYKVTRRYLKR